MKPPRELISAALQKGLFFLALLLVYLSPSVPAVMFAFGRSFIHAVYICLLPLAGLGLVLLLAGWVIGRRRSGRLVLDMDPNNARIVSLLVAVLCVLLGRVTTPFDFLSAPWSRYLSFAFLAAIALIFIILGSGRMQVCENGLWFFYRLRTWESIASFEMHSRGERRILTLERRGRLPGFLRREMHLIPRGWYDKLKSLLEGSLDDLKKADS